VFKNPQKKTKQNNLSYVFFLWIKIINKRAKFKSRFTHIVRKDINSFDCLRHNGKLYNIECR
jgi:hypothetical protein